MFPTNNLSELMLAWQWAKENTDVCHQTVDQHIHNLDNVIKGGFKIIPFINIDTLHTLRGDHEKSPENTNLIQFIPSMTQQNFETGNKRIRIISTQLSMASEFARQHEDIKKYRIICSQKSKNTTDFEKEKELFEMLIDDEADVSKYKKYYVSAVFPTWDKKLIRFPKSCV